MTIKKKDFIEIEYTGRRKEDNRIFDTTDEKLAKDSGMHSEGASYGPIIICVGEKHILPGLEKAVEGKEPGDYKFEIKPEDAFGKKNAKLIQLVPTKKFFEQKINPIAGLQVNIDGAIGTIRTVSGGRTLVDFNHPLSGKDVVYEIKVKRIVTDKKEQISAFFKLLGLKDIEIKIEAGRAKITTQKEMPKPLSDEFKKKIKELTGVEAEFVKKEEKKAEKPTPSAEKPGAAGKKPAKEAEKQVPAEKKAEAKQEAKAAEKPEIGSEKPAPDTTPAQ